jgi:hypothetical protein
MRKGLRILNLPRLPVIPAFACTTCCTTLSTHCARARKANTLVVQFPKSVAAVVVSAHERVGLCFALVFRHSRFVIATSVDQSSRRRADCCWRERRSTQAKDCGAAFLLRLAFFLAAVSACPPGASSNKRPAWYLLAVCSPRNTPDSHHGEGYPCDVPAPPCVPHAEQQDQGHQDARCVAGLCCFGVRRAIPYRSFRSAPAWALDGHMQWVQFRGHWMGICSGCNSGW